MGLLFPWPRARRESAAERAANHLTPAGSPPQKASPRRVRRSSLPSPRELAVFWSSPHDGQESPRNPDWRPARPSLRCRGAQQGEASLEPAGGGTARVESSQERWCPLSSRVPSLATVLLRLKAPGGPTLPQESGCSLGYGPGLRICLGSWFSVPPGTSQV